MLTRHKAHHLALIHTALVVVVAAAVVVVVVVVVARLTRVAPATPGASAGAPLHHQRRQRLLPRVWGGVDVT